MAVRHVIKASDGHILTNGEIYGTKIYLGEDISADDFREITLDEYRAILEANAADSSGGMHTAPTVPSDEATAEDYQNALKEMGVKI